jgi:glycine/D-amino acid oxidase-like deaminating enzyme
MTTHRTDIVIFGAGIAGLWLARRLDAAGYDALVLESGGIGGGQTIASQGIIHSGLKYAVAGNVNALAREISAMPERWRAAFESSGEIDLSAANIASSPQLMLIPGGFMGDLISLVSKKALGASLCDIPSEISEAGYKGKAVALNEPVVQTGSLVRALAEPIKDRIRKIDMKDLAFDGDAVVIGDQRIEASRLIFTAAQSNHEIAKMRGHDDGVETQKRPLLMPYMSPAPFAAWVHLVGKSDKPVATITSHQNKDGEIVWYFGGQVGERPKDDDPDAAIKAAKDALAKYMPGLDVSGAAWGTIGIDRVEGKAASEGWMPDTPVIHVAGKSLYCWPTKLTFAPMLGDRVLERLDPPSGAGENDFSFLPEAPYSEEPWNDA